MQQNNYKPAFRPFERGRKIYPRRDTPERTEQGSEGQSEVVQEQLFDYLRAHWLLSRESLDRRVIMDNQGERRHSLDGNTLTGQSLAQSAVNSKVHLPHIAALRLHPAREPSGQTQELHLAQTDGSVLLQPPRLRLCLTAGHDIQDLHQFDPVLRTGHQHFPQEFLSPPGNILITNSWQSLLDGLQQRGLINGFEGDTSVQHLVKDGPCTVNISLEAAPLSPQYLWSSMEGGTSPGQQLVPAEASQSQMRHLYPPVLEEDVGGLEVPVDQLNLMQGRHPQKDLPEDPKSLGLRETAAGANIIGQSATLAQLQEEVEVVL